METATITCHYHPRPLGGHDVRCEWEGSRFAPVMVSREIIDKMNLDPNSDDPLSWREWPKHIEIDGIPLRYLPKSENYENAFIYNTAFYLRVDGLNRLTWAYYVVRRHALRVFRFVYERSILTLHVWGLAEYPQAVRPSWRDIKLFKRITNGR
jgi:hypothetical protein